MVYYKTIDSPIGNITLTTDGNSLIGIHISGDRYFEAVEADWQLSQTQPILNQAQKELEEYFEGKKEDFKTPLDFAGTKFQHQVWQALLTIPFGKTVSYKDIAQTIGNPKAVRAVGTAVGTNPLPIIIPCHRVIAHDGSIGGYGAGIDCKKKLLKIENISIQKSEQ